MRPLTVGILTAAALAGAVPAAALGGDPAPDAGPSASASASATRGKTITLRPSRFGRILFDARRQAIYIFENDPKGRSVCTGACAKAWPPVFTKGKPRAANGVRASLLGTIKRGSRRQVTYAGKPLYYYAHESPGQVRCHNVDLNGGLWWVVGANGKRRP